MSYLKTLNANFDIMRKIHADLHSTTPHHVWNLRVEKVNQGKVLWLEGEQLGLSHRKHDMIVDPQFCPFSTCL